MKSAVLSRPALNWKLPSNRIFHSVRYSSTQANARRLWQRNYGDDGVLAGADVSNDAGDVGVHRAWRWWRSLLAALGVSQ